MSVVQRAFVVQEAFLLLLRACLWLQTCELALSLTTNQVVSSAKQSLSVTKAATQINKIICLYYVPMCILYNRF